MGTRSPGAVVAVAAAAAGAGWGAEANRWHPEERDAAAATPTPAGRVCRPAREAKEERRGPAPAVPGVENPPSPPRPGLSDYSPSGLIHIQEPALRHVQETEAKDQRGAAAVPAGADLYSGTMAAALP